MGECHLVPEALAEVSSSLEALAMRVECGLRTVNKLGETWPVDSLEVWAPGVGGGPQIELPGRAGRRQGAWRPESDAQQVAAG